jgi:hypothetical protein
MMGALKASWRLFFYYALLVSSTTLYCHININIFSSQANLLLFFFFCIIWLQVTTILDILLLCNIGLYTKDRCLLWLLSFFAFLSYLFCLKEYFFFYYYFLMDSLET